MATQQLSQVLQQLHHIYLLKEEAKLTDGELLERFYQHDAESAFEVLMARYGPMVLGVCQRLLRNAHDAEDAFQTVFLVLVHKGRTLLGRETIGNWLYGVAYHTALKVRATAVQRRSKESLAPVKSNEKQGDRDRWNDLLPVVDEELSKLSDKLREAIVLCDVLGKPPKEVAAQLGIPVGTLCWRLSSGRRKLAEGLKRRGITLCAGAATAVFSQSAVLAYVPAALISSTVKAATLIAAGQVAAASLISARVAALTEGVLNTMFVTKMKSIGAAALALCIGAGGLGIIWPGAQGGTVSEMDTPTSPLQGRQEAPRSSETRSLPNLLTGISLPLQQEQKAGDKKDTPKPIPPNIIKAWQDGGGVIGTMQANPYGYLGFMPGEKRPVGHLPGSLHAVAMPAFHLVGPQGSLGEILAKLPDPGVPFGLDFDFLDEEVKDFAGLKSLRMLNLRSTAVTDAGFKELTGLPALKDLQWLSLSGQMTGEALTELTKLKSLQSLTLMDTKITDLDLKELAPLKGLQALYLSRTEITDPGLKELVNLKNLQSLSLSGTKVTDAGLKELAGLTNLQMLNLDATQVSDAGLKEVAKLKSLQALHLGGTQVTDAGLNELAALTGLQALELWGTQVTGTGFKELAGLKNLRSLQISGAIVTDGGLKEIAALKSLQSIWLDGAQITDVGLKELAGLNKGLQLLWIGNTKVTDAGLKEVAGLKNLQLLMLNNTQVTDAGLKELAGLKSLAELYLSGTMVTEEGVAALQKALPACKIVGP